MPLNRRQFLSASLVATAAIACPTVPNAHSAPAGRRIPIGFLGVTYSHGPDKVRIAMTSDDWEFVGVCDPSELGRQTAAKLGANLITQEELFQRARVVAVESDIPDHAAHARLALQAGKHVHLEKPPALRLEEMQEIVRIARAQGLLVQTGYMWRYHPGFNAIFEAARRGWLGNIFLVRGFISNHLRPDSRKEWSQFAGGSMFELGSHLVDATVRLLGKPNGVHPFLRHHGRFEDSVQDNNVAVLEYDHATAVLINTALQPASTPARSFEVLGTNGTATLQPLEPPTLALDLATPAGPYHKGLQQPALPPYRRYVGDFVELAAAVRGERPLSVSLDEELLVTETLLRVSGML